MKQNIEWIKKQIDISSEVIKQMENICSEEILSSSKIIIESLNMGNKIFWCGNGGSAGQAQHLSAELVCGLRTHKRSALASISLTTDTSVISAWSNDVNFESIFSRQIEALGNKGDILVALSTSGKSKNIIEAIKIAHNLSVKTIGLCGIQSSEVKNLCDVNISIPSNDTQRIQEGHILAGHLICELIENHFID